MQKNSKKERFKVENFKPLKLQKARKALEKHLSAVQIHADTNEGYKKGLLKESTIWDKISNLFKF